MSNLQLHGEVVTWNVEAGDIAYSKIRDALQQAGLPTTAARELSPSSAFGRAIKHLKENRSIDKVDTKQRGRITFQLTRIEQTEDERLDFNYEAQVVLDTSTGSISCSDEFIEQQAIMLFDHAMATRNAQDVTRLVQTLFRDNADLFPINPRKGVAYFVPDQFSDFTGQVEKFLKICGGSLSRWPVPRGDENGDNSVAGAVTDGIDAMVTELNEAVAEWTDNTRPETMERACKRFQAIEYKMQAYSEYFGEQAQALEQRIEDGKRAVLDAVVKLQTA